MWRYWIQKVKEVELDGIQTWIVSNLHGFLQSQGGYDLVGFIKESQTHGVYASLRIRPYMGSEWKFGCFFARVVFDSESQGGRARRDPYLRFLEPTWATSGTGFIKEIQPQGL
ncbi:beta-galactosidase 7-like isoform X1 [Wolffia australiana]